MSGRRVSARKTGKKGGAARGAGPDGPPSAQGKSVALTDSERMGGPIGGAGYDFQTRYALVRLPQLLSDPAFKHLLLEGFEDVDIDFGAAREAVQVKNHEVGAREFKEVVTKFWEIDESHPGVNSRFTVACPSLGRDVQTLAGKLERLRAAEASFAGGREALATTTRDIEERIARLGLAPLARFIMDKVHAQTNLPRLNDDEAACDAFVAGAQKLRAYAKTPAADLRDAYTALFRLVANARAVTLSRAQINSTIRTAVRKAAAARPRAAGAESESLVEVATRVRVKKGARVKRIIGRESRGTSPSGKRKTVVGKDMVIEGEVGDLVGHSEKADGEDGN